MRESPAELRDELDQAKADLKRSETWILLGTFLLILPGIGIGAGGAIPFGLAGRVFPAIVFGGIGGLIFLFGVTLVSLMGNNSSQLKREIRDIERRMGRDNRSVAEKLVDGGVQWLLGKRK